MKRILMWVVAGAMLAGICVAQSVQSQASGSAAQETAVSADKSGAQAASSASAATSHGAKVSDKDAHAQTASASQVEAGSTVQAQLAKPLDARKNKVGDEVVAKTTQDVKSDGHVIVPKGSKLIGRVTEVKAHSKDQATSELGIAFDHAVLKNGTEMPLALGIQAIGRSPASAAAVADEPVMTGGGSAMGTSSARPAVGGGMVGGVRSTAGGVVNAAGSTAGTAVNTAGAAGGTAGAAGGAVSGSLSSSSQGVVGLQGLSLSSATSTATNASVVSSSTGNVHLDSGTEMVLRVNQ
jgi:hypothetical protein